MANLDWSDRANVGCLNGHVRNAQQYSSRNNHDNNCRFPNWQRQNTPKKHHYYPPQPTQRQTGKPPTLLRLDSAGESVEDFPNSPHRPFEGRSNERTQNSFLGNILSKVGYPLHPNGGTYLARTDKSPQGDINLDRLVEKFNSSCEMEPPHHQWPQHHHQSQMANQEVHLPERQPPMQPAKIVPAMTFNGGPYITWSSQDNRPRTFPAYYRFLNFVHFHPYNNATRIGRTHIPPISQPPHAWSGRIPQFHQRSPHKQCHPLRLSTCDQNKQAYHPREAKQFCGGKPKNNERMMQTKSPMSHQGEHSTIPKATSPHGITDASACKGHRKHFDKCRPQAAEANSLFVYNEKTSHPTPSNRTLRKEDNCRQSTIQSGPCEMPRASLSENMSTNTCSNSDPDDKVLSKQDRFQCTKTHYLADVCTKSNKRSCEKSCSSTSVNITNKQKDEKCNTISRSIASDDVTKPNNEQEEKYAANEPNSSGSKQMHSSIAYLLADYVDNSAVCSNDSDFSEVDEDAAEDFTDEINDTEIDNASSKLWESFQTSDPYNPIYGWKCLPDNSSRKDQVTTQEAADNTSNNVKDSTLTFNDSGVSVIQQSSDNDASSTSYSSTDESEESSECSDDEWSQDSGCDEEEQRIWDSLCRSNDPYDPMGGWRLQPSSASPTTNSLPTVPDVVLDDDTGPNNEQPSSASLVTKSVPTLPDVVLDDNTAPTNEQPTSLKTKLQSLPLHETFVDKNASSTRHPTVSFILGADDYSDSDSPDPDDDDDYETSDKDTLDSSAKYEDLWQSFESSSDPYNPINGWNCQSPSLLHRSASSPSELCKADTEEHDEPTPLSPEVHADGGQQILLKVPSNVSLIQSSSTGCLKSIWKKALQRDKETKAKKVSFCTQEPVIISPELPMWENEYKEARCGHWEELARDRCRFQRRICEAELIVAPCFTPAHRMKVFQKLYS
ncbi:uncharacterized protein [Amphiura filiformis]|uniref:uncharacterized protein n=1 Tax=Amphiura filiformis TaxID=82378 RepID=UPI003B21ADC2